MEQSNELLSALLSDPEKLSAAVSAVSSMLGTKPDGKDKEEDAAPAASLPGKPPSLPSSDGAKLISALKPFLSPERREKADKAAKLLSLAELAYGFKDIF